MSKSGLIILGIGGLWWMGCSGKAVIDAPVTATDGGPCATWCAARRPREESEGWCAVEDRIDASCEAHCGELLEDHPAEAVQACFEDDPMCFVESPTACVEHQARRLDCLSWCTHRETEHSTDGFCSLGTTPEACATTCVDALAEGLMQVEACVKDDPLCFLDLRDCAGS